MNDPVARYERDLAKRFPEGSATLMLGALHRAALERTDLVHLNGMCDEDEEVIWRRPPPDGLFAFAERRSVFTATPARPAVMDASEVLALDRERRDPRNTRAHQHAGSGRLADAKLETAPSWLVFAAPGARVEVLVGARATKSPPKAARIVRAGKATLMGDALVRTTLDARGWDVLELGGLTVEKRAALHLLVNAEVLAEGGEHIVVARSTGEEHETLAHLLAGLQDSAADALGQVEPLTLTRAGERLVLKYASDGAPDQCSVHWPAPVARGDIDTLRKLLTRGVMRGRIDE